MECNRFLRDLEHSEFVLAGVRGCSMYGKGHRIKKGTGMVGHVIGTRKMHYAPDVTRDPYYVACEPDTRAETIGRRSQRRKALRFRVRISACSTR